MNKEKNCIETPAVIDLRKQTREAYSGSKKLLDYESGEIVCLSVSGIGKPGGEAYADAIQTLYSFVYTLKFTLKGAEDCLISKSCPSSANGGILILLPLQLKIGAGPCRFEFPRK